MARRSGGETGSFIWSYHSETPSERRLATAMRRAGLRFGQEVPVRSFTVDFLVDEWLVVEVDGESHLVKGRAEKDASRQEAIEAMGFTVMRVPAGDLSSPGGLKRWVKRIEDRIRKGPPYRNQDKSPNRDYLRQIEEARKALRIGEAERKKREAQAYENSTNRDGPRSPRSFSHGEETMEDYFGSKAEDFGVLLDEYERRRPGDSRPIKDEDDVSEKSGRAGGRTRLKTARRLGRPYRR
ncbi:MAG: endonuclease domain-containing protein [Bacillota bacterium]